jgi:hypothetical protein
VAENDVVAGCPAASISASAHRQRQKSHTAKEKSLNIRAH